jgi:hypothetical protein
MDMALGITENESQTKGSIITRWSGVVATACAFGALFLVFWFTPMTNTTDAAQELSSFYNDEGKRLSLLIAEPLALIATAGFVLVFGRLARHLTAEGEERAASIVAAGGITFTALFLVAMVAHTVIAGTLAFTKAFTFDPDLAMVLSHFGYVTMVGAAAGAGVVAGTVGTAMRRGSIGSHRLGTFGCVVAALAVLSLFFVYLPLVVFLVWCLMVSRHLRNDT